MFFRCHARPYVLSMAFGQGRSLFSKNTCLGLAAHNAPTVQMRPGYRSHRSPGRNEVLRLDVASQEVVGIFPHPG